MENIGSIAYIVLGAVGGSGLIWLWYQFGGKIPLNAFNPFKAKESTDKEITVELQPETKPDDQNQSSSDTMQKQSDKVKNILGILVFALCFGFDPLYATSEVSILQAPKELTNQQIGHNFVDTANRFVKATEDEFNALITNSRKDTKLVVVESTKNTKTVKVSIPINEPIVVPTPDGLIKVDQRKDEVIERTVKIVCTNAGVSTATSGSGIWFGLNFGIGGTTNTFSEFSPQPVIFGEFINWGNDYTKVSLGGLVGSKRYGFGATFGPAIFLSNIRLIVAYSRDYGSSNQSIEVGIGSSLYLN